MQESQPKSQDNAQDETSYQAPAIESVVTPEEMEREVAYAGISSPSPGSGPITCA